MPIVSVEDLEAEIRTRTPVSLDTAAEECARAGHIWRELETGDRGPASYCGACLRLRLAYLRGASLASTVNGALRIGTWNVEHASAAKNPRRLVLIERLDGRGLFVAPSSRPAQNPSDACRPVLSFLAALSRWRRYTWNTTLGFLPPTAGIIGARVPQSAGPALTTA